MKRKANKKYQKLQQNNRKEITAKAIFVLAVVVLCGVMGYSVYAKYYAVQSDKAISVASGLYFNSNTLVALDSPKTDIKKVAQEDAAQIVTTINKERWSGGECLFSIEIRNFDSNLLYNDTNLNIEYKLKVMLLEAPEGATYTITEPYNHETKSLTYENGSSNILEYSGTLAGGTLHSDIYQLRINKETGTYNGAKVLFIAYPTAPQYAKESKTIVGVFQAVLSAAHLKVESHEFKVQKDAGYTASDWYRKVQDLSGLLYNVKTIGDVVSGNEGGDAPIAIVKWKSDFLKISKYDQYYVTAKANHTEADKWIWSETDADNVNWTCMKIQVWPYSSVDITFYKTPTFINTFGADVVKTLSTEEKATRKTQFEGLATAYTVDNSNSNGSGNP